MTYKALGRSIANYAAPVWSINASETNIGKIQRAQNEALRIITGSHKMCCIFGFPKYTHSVCWWRLAISAGGPLICMSVSV